MVTDLPPYIIHMSETETKSRISCPISDHNFTNRLGRCPKHNHQTNRRISFLFSSDLNSSPLKGFLVGRASLTWEAFWVHEDSVVTPCLLVQEPYVFSHNPSLWSDCFTPTFLGGLSTHCAPWRELHLCLGVKVSSAPGFPLVFFCWFCITLNELL